MTENHATEWISDELVELLPTQSETVGATYEEFYQWMTEKGKNPVQHDSLQTATAENYLDRLDKLHRISLTHLDPESRTGITPDEADELLLLLARDEVRKESGEAYHQSSKRKFSNAVQKYFEWQFHEGSMSFEWQPRVTFSDKSHTSAAKFSYEELGRILQEAKTHGSLPSYYETPEEEREQINGLVAQRLSKSKDEIARQDWLRADQSKKIWSLIAVGYDAALTPVEIQAARVSWYDPQRNVLVIPTKHASKQREKTEVGLAEETGEGLSEWIQERRHLEKYDGSNKLWLNREANPYQSGSLCSLLRKLCEQAGIPTEDRAIRWYSLRHSLGRNVTAEGTLAEANDQLRHESLETTQETYNETPIEKLRETVNETHKIANRAATDPDYEPFEETDEGEREQPSRDDLNPQVDDSEGVETSVGRGLVHINAVISDSTEERVDVAHTVLPEDEDSTD